MPEMVEIPKHLQDIVTSGKPIFTINEEGEITPVVGLSSLSLDHVLSSHNISEIIAPIFEDENFLVLKNELFTQIEDYIGLYLKFNSELDLNSELIKQVESGLGIIFYLWFLSIILHVYPNPIINVTFLGYSTALLYALYRWLDLAGNFVNLEPPEDLSLLNKQIYQQLCLILKEIGSDFELIEKDTHFHILALYSRYSGDDEKFKISDEPTNNMIDANDQNQLNILF